MSERRYSKDHEWVSLADGIATCGISAYAQEQLGDVVFVELPEPGRKLAQGDEAAVVESVKAASEVYAPIGGEVAEANQAIVDDPAKVNADAEGEGWFFRLKPSNPAELDALMDEAAYQDYVAGLA